MISDKKHRNLARQILNFIEDHPGLHNQQWFVNGDLETQFYSWANDEDANIPKHTTDLDVCGTTMCIAGSAVFIGSGVEAFSDHIIGKSAWESSGARLLGLDYNESRALFFEFNNDRALRKLEKVKDGIPFTRNDYKVQTEDGDRAGDYAPQFMIDMEQSA